jgi:pimeloyl-ACP methyl ester carboxylesterase
LRRWWCTVPRAYLPSAVALPPGRHHTVPVNGGHAAVVEWGEGPAVYLLHGWGGRHGDLGAFVLPLVEAGFRAVAIDVPGHGEAGVGKHGRRRTVVNEFSDALASVVAATGPAYGVIAHSAGATATAVAVLDGVPVDRLALIAPMGEPRYFTAQVRTAFGYGDRIESRFHQLMEQWAGRPLDDLDVARRVNERTGLPSMLVVHDEGDRRNPYTHGEAIARAWPGAELQRTTGLGHSRMLRDEKVVNSVVSFLDVDVTTPLGPDLKT